MKTFFILSVLAAVAVARPEEDLYPDRYDNVNLDEILGNPRLLSPYVLCALEKQKKCSTEAKELRSHIKEALETNCAKCTKAQKSGTRRVIAHLINNEPEYWKELSLKYDKDGTFTAKYEAELKTLKKE